MERDRVLTRIFEDKPSGRRRVGRPRLKWLGGVESDLRMGVKIWRNTTKDREEWHQIVREARALHGP
jgi:hypothetical protein